MCATVTNTLRLTLLLVFEATPQASPALNLFCVISFAIVAAKNPAKQDFQITMMNVHLLVLPGQTPLPVDGQWPAAGALCTLNELIICGVRSPGLCSHACTDEPPNRHSHPTDTDMDNQPNNRRDQD